MRVGFFTIAMAVLVILAGHAQPVLTPRNIGLGGGGSTYITDYNANFINPANLMIRDRNNTFDFGFGISGAYYNGVLNELNVYDQAKNYRNYLRSFQPGAYSITQQDKDDILSVNYKRNRLSSVHQSRFESTLAGMRWWTENRSFSLAIRSRTASTFEAGRGWYSPVAVTTDNGSLIDQTLKHRYQILHEVSFGYAESIGHFNGLSSRLDNFLIGIAPKLVLAGPYQSASWINRYTSSGAGTYEHAQQFEYISSGDFSDATAAYMTGTAAAQAIRDNISSVEDMARQIEGIGAGLDIGVTYLITIGSDLSTINTGDERTTRSLRLSFSVTDIGFVRYREGGIVFEAQTDTAAVMALPSQADDVFVGAPGQFLDFAHRFASSDPFSQFRSSERNSFNSLLPTTLNGGVLLELNRLKLMGDLSIGLSNTAFTTTRLVTSAGVEIRPLTFLPIRAGTQLAPGLPGFFSFGAAIETAYWDLSVSTQLSTRSITTNPALAGITMGALQFHF